MSRLGKDLWEIARYRHWGLLFGFSGMLAGFLATGHRSTEARFWVAFGIWSAVYALCAILTDLPMIQPKDIPHRMTITEWIKFRKRLRMFQKQMDQPFRYLGRPAPSKPPKPPEPS